MTGETSSSTIDDEQYREFAELSQYLTALVLYPIVSLIGMAGSLLCIAVLSQRQMLTSTNAYLIALAVADLMKLANDFLYFPATLLQLNGSRRGGAVFAHLYPYAFFLSQYTSGCAAWLTVVVAGERFLMVTHPNWSRYSLTVRKSRIVSAITYATVLLVTWPYLLRYETVCEVASSEDAKNSTMSRLSWTATSGYNDSGGSNGTNSTECTWRPVPSRLWSNGVLANYSKYYVQCQSCLKSLVPLLILIVLNVRIVMAVRETRANKKLASRNRVTIMLVMVILCYIVFTMPDSALSAMGWGYTEVQTNLRRGVREISDLLLAVNSSVNFFLYVAFNKVFRQNLLGLCCQAAAGPIEARQQTAGLGADGARDGGCSRRSAACAQLKARSQSAAGGVLAEDGAGQRRHQQHRPGDKTATSGTNCCSKTIDEVGATSVVAEGLSESPMKAKVDDEESAALPARIVGDISDCDSDHESSLNRPEQWTFLQRMTHRRGRPDFRRHSDQPDGCRRDGSWNRRHGSSGHPLVQQQQQQSDVELLTALLHSDSPDCCHADPAEYTERNGFNGGENNLAGKAAHQVQVVVSLVVHRRSPSEEECS